MKTFIIALGFVVLTSAAQAQSNAYNQYQYGQALQQWKQNAQRNNLMQRLGQPTTPNYTPPAPIYTPPRQPVRRLRCTGLGAYRRCY